MGRRGIAALGLGVLALAGCGVQAAGEAAVSEEFRISQAEVDAEVRLVLEGLGQPVGDPPADLALATTQRLVQDALAGAAAEDLGIEVTKGDVEDGLVALAEQNGGQEALEQAALQAGIPPESLEDFVRTNLRFQEIGATLGATGDPQAALAEYSDRIDLQVAPRYGTWDATQLVIVPGSSVVSSPTGTVEP